MNNRTIVLIIALLVIIVVGMFGYAYLKKAELTDPVTEPTTNNGTEEGPYDHITRIDATHFFIDGTHTIVGSISLPTQCDLLETSARVAESMPEQITYEFSVINSEPDCEPATLDQRFSIAVTASEFASHSAEFMGRRVELNLTPAPEGERPEDFEIFIKG